MLCDLLDELGLPINASILTPPTKQLTCLGIDINIDTNTMSIAEDKLEAIYAECIAVSNKNSLSKQAYQSLLGKLIYIQKCVKPSRTFINRILDLFRKNSHQKKIKLNDEFQKDIRWFLTFLPTYNGVSYIKKTEVEDSQSLFLDACLTGMGAVWRNKVYATPIHNFGDLKLSIVHFEMLNLVIALRVWGSSWQHKHLKVHCDNLGVVQVVKTGKTKDPFLALCIRNIWLLTASHDIDLDISHIPGTFNIIADALSRLYSDRTVHRDILTMLSAYYYWEKVPVSYFNLETHL